jgi:hypothetical protein
MNGAAYNGLSIDRVARGVYERLTNHPHETGFDTPYPRDVSDAERANYILFAVVVEAHIATHYQSDRDRVQRAWKYLAWIVGQGDHPMMPNSIVAGVDSNSSFYERIVNREGAPMDAALPSGAELRADVDDAAMRLASYFSGDATNLASSWFGLRLSVQAVIRRLFGFRAFRGQGEALPRVFLKVAKRQGIWPTLRGGPFLFPFSRRVALLILNAECVRLVCNDMGIPIQDQQLQDLISGAVDRVAAKVRDIMNTDSDRRRVAAICEKQFGVNTPDEVLEAQFTDEVDFLLWDHAGRFCGSWPPGRDKRGNRCTFCAVGETCICLEHATELWTVEKDRFVQRTLGDDSK